MKTNKKEELLKLLKGMSKTTLNSYKVKQLKEMLLVLKPNMTYEADVGPKSYVVDYLQAGYCGTRKY